MNLIKYIEHHQNTSFKELPLTEVDSLILSLIPYLKFTHIIPAFYSKKITIAQAADLLNQKNEKFTIFEKNTYKMFQALSTAPRYKDILLYNYMSIVNDEMQFDALTMKLSDKSIFIAFAGTDTSIIGWKEDFKLAYLYPTATQKYATVYLNKAVKLLDKKVYLGGHSKGGNLSISAAMNTKFYIRSRIKAIYNFDGPGFLKKQAESKAYQKISSKIRMFVPKCSIIGMILYHQENYTVVKSTSFNILQHDAFTWVCDNTHFIPDHQQKRSKNIEFKLTKKLEELSITERETIVENIFSIFKTNDIKDAKDITISKIFSLLKSITKLDKDTKNLLAELLIMLFLK